MRAPTVMMLPFLAVLFAGCSGAPSPSPSYDRVSGQDDSWSVGAANPRFESLDACNDDPSIEISALSLDMPSSRLGIRLVPGSTEADALRIADCLASALISGEIWVSAPAG